MTIDAQHKDALAALLLAVADDKLMLGHRNSDWTGLGPILEEDIAFSALAQDEIAHAQAIYRFVGDFLDHDENELAFGRQPQEYRCARIVEPADDFDWAVAIVRQFFCDHFDLLRLGRLAKSAHKPLADLAARIAEEEQVHVEHADSWMQRLGRGTDESRDRLKMALVTLSPMTPSLFERVEGEEALEAAGLYPRGETDMATMWLSRVESVLAKSGLKTELPDLSNPPRNGRSGQHSDAFIELLDEMCEVYRLEPGAKW